MGSAGLERQCCCLRCAAALHAAWRMTPCRPRMRNPLAVLCSRWREYRFHVEEGDDEVVVSVAMEGEAGTTGRASFDLFLKAEQPAGELLAGCASAAAPPAGQAVSNAATVPWCAVACSSSRPCLVACSFTCAPCPCRLGPPPIRHAAQVECGHPGVCRQSCKQGHRCCGRLPTRLRHGGMSSMADQQQLHFSVHVISSPHGMPLPCLAALHHPPGPGAGGGHAAVAEHLAPRRLVCRRGEPGVGQGWCQKSCFCHSGCNYAERRLLVLRLPAGWRPRAGGLHPHHQQV